MTISRLILIFLISGSALWLSGCGYHLVGTQTNDAQPRFNISRVLLAEAVEENIALLRAIDDLNYRLVDKNEAYSYKIVAADCDGFSIENTGEQETVDLLCTLDIGESVPEARSYQRREIVRIGNSNDEVEQQDRLEAEANLYTNLLRSLH